VVALIAPDASTLALRNRFRQQCRMLKKAYASQGITKVRFVFRGYITDPPELDEPYYWNDRSESITIYDEIMLPDFGEDELDSDLLDSIPRVEMRDLWEVETAMGRNLLDLCEEARWNELGGVATIEWDLATDIFAVSVADYFKIMGPERHMVYPNGQITVEQSTVTVHHF